MTVVRRRCEQPWRCGGAEQGIQGLGRGCKTSVEEPNRDQLAPDGRWPAIGQLISPDSSSYPARTQF
jgi:hypothetical protein